MALTLEQINTAISYQKWTVQDVESLIRSVKYARSQLGRANISKINVGDNVNFTSSRTGVNTTGVVTKVAIKYVTVKTISGLWRVPASMLTVIADEKELA